MREPAPQNMSKDLRKKNERLHGANRSSMICVSGETEAFIQSGKDPETDSLRERERNASPNKASKHRNF